MTDQTLKTTPLNAAHRALGARMVGFGGYDMPVQYEGVLAEHRWTREHAGLFDVSHMGQCKITGEDATAQFHLSQSAILRTLRDELGVTFSSVVKWERLCVALRLIVDGASVTEAAVGGGFFDGPHFTRACNEMLGLPPKLLDVGLVQPG